MVHMQDQYLKELKTYCWENDFTPEPTRAERLAYFADWYRFAADNQEFDRNQAFEHACKMEELLRGKSGQNDLAGASGDVKISQFVRVDINA